MLNKPVTIICLVLLIGEVVFLLFNFLFKKRKDKILFLRNFKKGKFAVIYLTAFPLFLIGHLDNGCNIIEAFFTAINSVFNLVVIRFDVNGIANLMAKDDLYEFAIYFCFILAGINAILFTLSLTVQYVWCAIREAEAFLTRKSKLYIFGHNPENIAIYLSEKKRNKVIIDSISDADCERLYLEKISYISSDYLSTKIKRLINVVKKLDREYVFVINTGDDEKNMALC